MAPELDLGRSALLTDLAMCINHYRLYSPGIFCCVHATVELEGGSRFQPGVVVQVNHGQLKQCDPGKSYDYFRGAPNFILDVFASGETEEYEHRRKSFEAAGAIEYVGVWLDDPVTWVWNQLANGEFVAVETKNNEVIQSLALPGLWIRPSDLAARDWWAIMATIDRGVSRKDHHDFMEKIWHADKPSSRSTS